MKKGEVVNLSILKLILIIIQVFPLEVILV